MPLRIFFVLSLFLIVGCGAERPSNIKFNPERAFIKTDDPARFDRNATVEVSVEKKDVGAGETPAEAVWDAAEKKGMAELLRSYTSEFPVFILQDNLRPDYPPLRFEKPALSAPFQDTLSGNFKGRFLFRSEFLPDKALAGIVVNLGDRSLVAGSGQLMYVSFFSPENVTVPSYALLARPLPYDRGIEDYILGRNNAAAQSPPHGNVNAQGNATAERPTYFQVFGSARFYQMEGKIGLALIQESRIEVSVGELVFLLNVQAEEDSDFPPDLQTDGNDTPEVVVEPVWEPRPLGNVLPGESK